MSNLIKITDQLLLEWIEICKTFLLFYGPTYHWYDKAVLYKMWHGISTTKYLSKQLISLIYEEPVDSITFTLSINPALTMELVLAFPDISWNYTHIGRHVKIEDIIKHPEINWNWDVVSRNLNITYELIFKYIKEIPMKKWNKKLLICHPCTTARILTTQMEENTPKPDHWEHISKNPNLNMSIIELYIDKPWNWKIISQYMKLTINILINNPDKPWDYNALSRNTSITLEILLSTPDKPWNFVILSGNQCLTIDMLLAYPDATWNWYDIGYNKSITLSDIEYHMDLPWNWRGISNSNPNITVTDIESHLDFPWDWNEGNGISHNTHTYNPDKYVERWLCRYSLISLHDEDYERGEEYLDYDNVVDLVIQNVYCISCIMDYL